MKIQIVLVCTAQSQTNQLIPYLEQQGWQVTTVATGEKALSRLEQILPDVAIMEVALPDITGLEIIKLMRQTPKMFRTPVILIFPSGAPDEDYFQGHMSGADCSLAEPITPLEIVRFILRILEAREEGYYA